MEVAKVRIVLCEATSGFGRLFAFAIRPES